MFEGFPRDAIKFFRQLKKNNNREWFAENKPWYEQSVLLPAMELVTDMAKPLQKISPCFSAISKRSGGSLMRIYRDTRFSKDKTPYKLNLGIHFRHVQGKDVHAPGFYFHVAQGEIFFGAGIWRPDSPSIAKIRTLIDDDPKRWKRVVNAKKFKGMFERRGEKLKRPPRGYEADHALIDDLKFKDHFAMAPLDESVLFDRNLMDVLVTNMKGSMPYMRFLCDSLHVPC